MAPGAESVASTTCVTASRQAAAVALSEFSAFAGRTIEGEIKRHFRDRAWWVRVPRSAKELHLAVRRANDELTQRLGRSPSVPEVAEHLGISRDDVITGLSAAAARSVGSIDTSTSDDDTAIDRREAIADIETGFAKTDDEQVVEMLLEMLPEREREIVRLRFYEDMSQADIAERCGISQMHVRDFCDARSTRCDARSTSSSPNVGYFVDAKPSGASDERTFAVSSMRVSRCHGQLGPIPRDRPKRALEKGMQCTQQSESSSLLPARS